MQSSLPPLMLMALVTFACAAKLPSSLKTCKQNSEDFEGCLKNALQHAVPLLVKGFPELHLPPLDPMHFKQIKIEGTHEQPVTLELIFNDVKITGIANGIVDAIEMKPGSYHMKAKMHSDSPFSLIADYIAEGHILVLPVKGNGKCNITSPRLDVELEMIGQPIERDGETHWDVTDFKVKLKNMNKLWLHFTGISNNDKVVGDNILKFLNENSGEIANEVNPAYEEALGTAFKAMAKSVFDKCPYNSVFPPE